jgi:hypothetical protein
MTLVMLPPQWYLLFSSLGRESRGRSMEMALFLIRYGGMGRGENKLDHFMHQMLLKPFPLENNQLLLVIRGW